MRQFILDSLLLYYNAMCRPTQLQRQLNEWLPQKNRDKNNNPWRDIITYKIDRKKNKSTIKRIWLLCWTWWFPGVIGLFIGGYYADFSLPFIVFLSIMLIIVSRGTMPTSQALGLNLPLIISIGVTISPMFWVTPQTVLTQWIPLPMMVTGLLAYMGAQIAGVTTTYKLVAYQYSLLSQFLIIPTMMGLGALVGGYLGLIVGNMGLWLLLTIWMLGMVWSIIILDPDINKSKINHDSITKAADIAGKVAGIMAGVMLGVVVAVVMGVIVGVMAGVVIGVVMGVAAIASIPVMAQRVNGSVIALVIAFNSAGILMLGTLAGVGGSVTVISTLPRGWVWAIIFILAWLLQPGNKWLFDPGVVSLWLFISISIILNFSYGTWTEFGVSIIVVILGLSGLPFNLMAWVWGHVTWLRFRMRSTLPTLLLDGLPPFSDETIWLPVPHLNDLLVLVARENRKLALQLIGEVAESRQEWAANPALIQITADSLAACDSVEKLPLTIKSIDWLPDNVAILGSDIAEVWPRLQGISQDVKSSLKSASPYNRRLGLDQARDSLNRLRQSLVPLGQVAITRWQPVLDQWLKLLDEPLRQPLLAKGKAIVNPYDSGNPLNLQRSALFRGRDEVTATLVNALLERNRPTLVLHGPRRIGKSSFLLQLPRLLPGRVIPIFLDLQRAGMTDSAGDFGYGLARAIQREAQIQRKLSLPAPPARADFRAHPYNTLSDWLDEQAIPALRGDFSLLLCFDEFEKLGSAIAAGRLDERLLDELRHTIQHRQAISLLFAGVQTLEDLGPRWSSYFISVRPLEIPYLSEAEARDLIIAPDRQVHFPLEYAPAAVSQIITVTRCQPYLVQLVCSAVVQLANRDRTLLATPALVTEAISKSLDDGAPYFQNVWEETPGTTPDMLALGQNLLRQIAATDPTPYSLLPTPDIQPALTRLLRYKVLVQLDGAGYRFDVPLLARWVRERA